ncbi:hypothetical protein SLEP1_g34265 [Rubroshorea leprosula]|uniref:Uncharacterized protein n=1 Tax=Rubroshorea leprosula TaxID=152421 RepID=A0AAV5KJ87_9ROSI|nr:hypothetical protein SLEP1_g34265 [Rubroshorea leprosula]
MGQAAQLNPFHDLPAMDTKVWFIFLQFIPGEFSHSKIKKEIFQENHPSHIGGKGHMFLNMAI